MFEYSNEFRRRKMKSDCSNEVFVSATEEHIKKTQEALGRVRTNLESYLHPSTLSAIMDQPLPPHLLAELLPPLPDVDDDVADDDDDRDLREKRKQLGFQLRQLQEETKQILKVQHHLRKYHFTGIISAVIRPFLDQVNISLASYRTKVGISPRDERMLIDKLLKVHLDEQDCGLGQQQQI